jgi:hypothetical protein
VVRSGMEGTDLKDYKDNRRYDFEEDLPPRRGSLSILDSLWETTQPMLMCLIRWQYSCNTDTGKIVHNGPLLCKNDDGDDFYWDFFGGCREDAVA